MDGCINQERECEEGEAEMGNERHYEEVSVKLGGKKEDGRTCERGV